MYKVIEDMRKENLAEGLERGLAKDSARGCAEGTFYNRLDNLKSIHERTTHDGGTGDESVEDSEPRAKS